MSHTISHTMSHHYIFSLISAVLEQFSTGTTDIKALRAFRVLRPLRLVSGVPSEYYIHLHICITYTDINNLFRLTSGVKFNYSCHDTPFTHYYVGM